VESMSRYRHLLALRVTAVATVASLALLFGRLSTWAAARPLHEVRRQLVDGAPPAGGWTLDRLVVDTAAAALGGVGAVIAFLVLLNTVGVLAGSLAPAFDELVNRVTPGWLRRTTLALCGVALAAGTAPTAAQAFDAGGSSVPHARTSPVSGLPLPDLPISATKTVVTVSPGDSLWTIARRGLPADAPDSAVAARAARIYAANRRLIGDDPNLIFPGQKFTAPGGVA
jgi:LysM domain